MRKLLSFIADAPYRLMAAATVGAAAIGASEAKADGIGDVANNIQGELQGVGNLFVAGAFLGGIALSGAGLLKLKAAADTQGQQVKYGEGLWRLGVGAGLVALPAVTGIGKDTVFGTGGGDRAPDMGSINIR